MRIQLDTAGDASTRADGARPARHPGSPGIFYANLLNWTFVAFNSIRLLTYLPMLWAIHTSADSSQHSLLTWVGWVGSNATMAAWLYENNGRRLNKAFQRAFNVAKQIRTETNIQRGSVSVGSVAVELAEKIFSAVNDRHVLVIGAGDTSEKTARALLSRGAKSILVSNRSHERAVALAGELGGRAVRFEDWAGEFEKVDIVISSTAAPHHILDRVKLGPLMKLRTLPNSLVLARMISRKPRSA